MENNTLPEAPVSLNFRVTNELGLDEQWTFRGETVTQVKQNKEEFLKTIYATYQKPVEVTSNVTPAGDSGKFCTIHGIALKTGISKKTGAPYEYHIQDSKFCFGS